MTEDFHMCFNFSEKMGVRMRVDNNGRNLLDFVRESMQLNSTVEALI